MIFRYHEKFGQWHVPNLRAYVPHESGYFVVRTNRDGMRASRDYSYRAPGGAPRILLFGDSFTAGEGIHNEDRFSDGLERMVGGEVLNFGLDGSGIDQQLLIFEEMSHRFDGDTVLFCPLVENIRRVQRSHWAVLDRTSGEVVFVAKPYFTLEDGTLQVHQVPVPRRRLSLAEAPEEMRRLVEPGGRAAAARRLVGRLLGPLKPFARELATRLVRAQPFPEYDSARTPAWRLTRALLERLVAKATPRRVVLAPLPYFPYIEGGSRPTYLERYREFASDHPQILFLDLLPYFRALPLRQRRQCRFGRDVHYTPLAHAIVARALFEELADRGLVPRGNGRFTGPEIG